MERTQAKIINDWLKLGPKNLAGENVFRLVWSEDLYELRLGEFNDFEGETFIRTRKGVEKVKKYNWIYNKWILEQYYPPEISINPELPESHNGTYEPLYVFEDTFGKILPLKLEVVQFLVRNSLNPRSSREKIRSAIREEMELEEKKIDKKDQEIIGDGSSTPMESLFHFGEAILNPWEGRRK